jgi:poly(ADP-ribose) glycohydrolase ARH3
MRSDVRQRLRGALLGLALGDAVGAPFEGRSRVRIDEVQRWLDADRVLRWTDDTHMALTLGRALVEGGGSLDPERLGDAFAEAYAAEPWRGYGAGPPQVFALVRSGMSYVEAAGTLFGGTGSFGNGAAMRVAPVALVAGTDPDRAATLAADQARVTHTHPDAVDGAVFVATVLCGLAANGSTDAATALRDAAYRLRPGAIRDTITELLAAASAGADPLEVARRGGTGVAAIESVPAAAAAVLAGADVVGTMVAAVELSGDTDTIAAMAGAMAAAFHGVSGIPQRLLDRLEDRERIDALASALVTL